MTEDERIEEWKYIKDCNWKPVPYRIYLSPKIKICVTILRLYMKCTDVKVGYGDGKENGVVREGRSKEDKCGVADTFWTFKNQARKGQDGHVH